MMIPYTMTVTFHSFADTQLLNIDDDRKIRPLATEVSPQFNDREPRWVWGPKSRPFLNLGNDEALSLIGTCIN
jgi:hypothetical protein